MESRRRKINGVLALLSISVGAVVCAWLIYTKPVPPRRNHFARVLEVAVTPVEQVMESTPVIGHGTVRAKNQVKIVPQTSGELIFVHADLAMGKQIPEGELLFEVEPSVYEARVLQAEAEVKRLEASLGRSDAEFASLGTRIANAERMLAIDKADYETSMQLYDEQNVGTPRDVDVVHQKYLRQNDALIELKSRRSLIPHAKLETQATLDAARARLKQDQLNLKNTKIYCPFYARVEMVSAYRSQVVTAHFSIATLTDMSAFELSVGVDPRDLRWLDESIRPDALSQKQDGTGPEVTVKWSLQGQELTWRGFVTRFERVDEATRTARLVVEIRQIDMVAKARLGGGDAATTLAIGMHCRAELPARPLTDAVLVPRHAIYDNRWVYVYEPDAESDRNGRLGRREVPILRSVDDSVLVDYADRDGGQVCELQPGELVIVSPLVKPIVGMKVRLHNTRQANARRSATGQVAQLAAARFISGQVRSTHGAG